MKDDTKQKAKKVETQKTAGHEPQRKDDEPFIFRDDKKLIEELASQNKYIRSLFTTS